MCKVSLFQDAYEFFQFFSTFVNIYLVTRFYITLFYFSVIALNFFRKQYCNKSKKALKKFNHIQINQRIYNIRHKRKETPVYLSEFFLQFINDFSIL